MKPRSESKRRQFLRRAGLGLTTLTVFLAAAFVAVLRQMAAPWVAGGEAGCKIYVAAGDDILRSPQ
jgi:hypothetical protein